MESNTTVACEIEYIQDTQNTSEEYIVQFIPHNKVLHHI